MVCDEDVRRLGGEVLFAADLHAVHDGHPRSEHRTDNGVKHRIKMARLASDIAQTLRGCQVQVSRLLIFEWLQVSPL